MRQTSVVTVDTTMHWHSEQPFGRLGLSENRRPLATCSPFAITGGTPLTNRTFGFPAAPRP